MDDNLEDRVNRLSGLMAGLIQELAPFLGVERLQRIHNQAEDWVNQGREARKTNGG